MIDFYASVECALQDNAERAKTLYEIKARLIGDKINVGSGALCRDAACLPADIPALKQERDE